VTKSIFDPDQIGSVLEKILTEMANRVEAGGVIEISYWVVGDAILVSVSDEAMHDQRIPPTLDPELPPEGIDPSFSILSAVFERYSGRIWQDRHTGDYRFTLPFLNERDAEEFGVTFTQYSSKENKPETPSMRELVNNN